MRMAYDRVHTVSHFHDHIRSGFADLDGRPHAFDAVFDDAADDYSGQFQLTPITADLLARALRQHAIFTAWQTRFTAGQADRATHPLRADAEFKLLEARKVAEMATITPLTVLYSATFRDGQVEWTPVP